MDNFWSIIWIVVWSFFFVAYLFVLFYILTDLFRDRDLSGWWKALWIIFLIFAPYLTALVYIIARGRGMSERQVCCRPHFRREGAARQRHHQPGRVRSAEGQGAGLICN